MCHNYLTKCTLCLYNISKRKGKYTGMGKIIVMESAVVRVGDREWEKVAFYKGLARFFKTNESLMKKGDYKRLFLETMEYLFYYLIEKQGMNVKKKALLSVILEMDEEQDNKEIFTKELVDEFLAYRKTVWDKGVLRING